MAEEISNLAVTTLSSAMDGSTTTANVTSGSAMPATGNFRLKIDSEIVVCTARTGNVCTVTRGAEGTTATSHSSGAAVKLVLTKQALFNLILERKNAPSIEDYGAKAQVGFDNTSAIQDALDDAPNVYGKVAIPANKTYEADGQVVIPTKTVLEVNGTLKCTASPTLGGAFVLMDAGTGNQGKDGGIIGNGAILGNLSTTWVIIIDSWRGARLENFVFGEGTFGGLLMQDNEGVDTDSTEVRGVTHRNNTALAGGDPYAISKVAFRLQGSGGRVTDNNFYGTQIIGGLRPATTATANDGGIGYELINADRNTFYSPKSYSHFTASDGAGKSLKWNYAFKIYADVDDAGGNVLVNPYTEATTTAGDANGTANTTWKFWVLHVTVDDTFHADFTKVYMSQMSIDASGANALRVETVVNGSGTMHGFEYRSPKNTIGTAGQMDLDSGMTGGLVEVLSTAEKSRVTLNGGTGVNVVALNEL
jgi:hypothetical protein